MNSWTDKWKNVQLRCSHLCGPNCSFFTVQLSLKIRKDITMKNSDPNVLFAPNWRHVGVFLVLTFGLSWSARPCSLPERWIEQPRLRHYRSIADAAAGLQRDRARPVLFSREPALSRPARRARDAGFTTIPAADGDLRPGRAGHRGWPRPRSPLAAAAGIVPQLAAFLGLLLLSSYAWSPAARRWPGWGWPGATGSYTALRPGHRRLLRAAGAAQCRAWAWGRPARAHPRAAGPQSRAFRATGRGAIGAAGAHPGHRDGLRRGVWLARLSAGRAVQVGPGARRAADGPDLGRLALAA